MGKSESGGGCQEVFFTASNNSGGEMSLEGCNGTELGKQFF